MSAVIYHNPRCSKSRKAIEILDENHISYEVYPYLDKGLEKNQIQSLSKKLGVKVEDFIRKKEDIYKDLAKGLKSDDDYVQVLIEHPKLLERPIVVFNENAVIGRPPENILSLFSND